MITDRELLVLCDLTNLKIEHMDIAEERDSDDDKIIIKYHTLYSLVDSLEDNTEFMENYDGSWNKVTSDAKALFETYSCSETSYWTFVTFISR